MKVTYLPDVEPRPRRVAVGVFDGVHLGHREVIGGSDTVLTFEPHPLSVIQPATAPKLLTRLDVKADLVEELGVEEMVVIPFDDAFAARSAEDFVSDVLVDALQATRVSVGRNFRFGNKARGDAALLAADERVAAAINIGVRPLFETGRGVLIEAHLIDHDDDLYGTELRIDFLSRLRGERLFDSVDALVEEIARDVERTRELAG